MNPLDYALRYLVSTARGAVGIKPQSPIPEHEALNSELGMEAAKAKQLYGTGIQKIDEANRRNNKGNVLGAAIENIRSHLAAQAAPTPTLAPGADQFEQVALPILNEYQIPPSVGFGMRDAEGGRIGNNNVYNINATDSNPNGATNYADPKDAVRAFAELIAKDPRYHKAYEARNNPDAMIEEIAKAGYAGDISDWKQRSARHGGAGTIYDSYPEFVKNTPGYKRYLQR